jgi:ABC-2 type transport system ATP-binding protein
MYDITKKFTVGPANFKSLGKELKLEVQLGNAMLMNYTGIDTTRTSDSFCGKIPSVNDIFIQTVSEK